MVCREDMTLWAAWRFIYDFIQMHIYQRNTDVYKIRCFQAYLLEIGKNRKHFIDFFYCVVHVLYEDGGRSTFNVLEEIAKIGYSMGNYKIL